jgi:hypothetical protein
MRMRTLWLLVIPLMTTMPLGASAKDSAEPTSAGNIRFVDFPLRIDPYGQYKHIPMQLGSRLFFRPGILARQTLTSRQGKRVEQVFVLDGESFITRAPGETLIVEPDGTKWHLSPRVQIERSTRSYKYVVIPPDRPLPQYLRSVGADIEVR